MRGVGPQQGQGGGSGLDLGHQRNKRCPHAKAVAHCTCMRSPVYSARSNPDIDPPILRKSMAYLQLQVGDGLADWVDSNDPRKGIICREKLHFGPHREMPKPVESTPYVLPPIELHDCTFEPPANSASATAQKNARQLISDARQFVITEGFKQFCEAQA